MTHHYECTACGARVVTLRDFSDHLGNIHKIEGPFQEQLADGTWVPAHLARPPASSSSIGREEPDDA